MHMLGIMPPLTIQAHLLPLTIGYWKRVRHFVIRVHVEEDHQNDLKRVRLALRALSLEEEAKGCL